MEPWRRFDLASREEAREKLRTCCGSARWVDGMLRARPFGSREGMLAAAREQWFALTPEDWREAFDHHPRIGDRQSRRRRFAATRHLSAKEQAGVDDAPEEALTALADGNRAYEEKFGYIFIVCATGRTADEMVAMLRARLNNDPETEIRIAADEQAKITELRLLQG
jgi:2-oxo-4-hydroxy-4-carboxy-5-ureidoimidazoline decarboxylase